MEAAVKQPAINNTGTEPRSTIYFDNIPDELKALPRWVMWKLEPGNDGKLTKVPYNARKGKKAQSNNPDTWTSFDFCRKMFEMGHYSGIGFELSYDDDIICIDLDDKAGSDKISEYVDLSKRFDSWTEISYSGNGLHIWCKGKKPGSSCRRGDLEIYERDRFIAITGHQVDGSPGRLNYAQVQINEFYSEIESATPESSRWGGQLITSPELSDDEIIRLASKNSHGFFSLWRGDFSRYPSQSEADGALTCILAWYTKDIHQIDRLFRQSGLYREKWDRIDYKTKTIETALRKVPGKFDPRYRRPAPVTPGNVQNSNFRLTDLGNAERFKALFGDTVLYCPTLKKWFVWNGKIWEFDSTQKRELLAIDTVRRIYGEAEEHPDEKQRSKIGNWALASESHNRRTAMLQTVSSMLAIHHDELDAKPDLFNLQNGTYNLYTHEFREHRQEDLLTKLSGVEYTPSLKCPTWIKHLNLIFSGDTDLINGFQELCGYSLLSGNPAEIFVVAWGTGRNGKGKTFDAISHVFGDYSGNTPFSTFVASKYGGGRGSASPELVDLIGTRFVKASESEEGARLSEALIKTIAGGDPLTARGLYQGYVTFKPEFTIFLQTNHKPVIRNWDQAIEARLWLIPFDVYIEQKDRDYHILDKLIAEGSGIFNWMLEGLKRYQEKGRLIQPKAIKKATDEYKQEQDKLGEFVSSLCVKGKDEFCYRTDLFHAYERDCQFSGIEPLHKNTFSKLLQSHHNVRDGGRDFKGRKWNGIRLKNEHDTYDIRNENFSNKSNQENFAKYNDIVTFGQEEAPFPLENPQKGKGLPCHHDTDVTRSHKSVREGDIRESYETSCHECHGVMEWLSHYKFPADFPLTDYVVIPKEKRKGLYCYCHPCDDKDHPLYWVPGRYHQICQHHFNELQDLLKKEQEGNQ